MKKVTILMAVYKPDPTYFAKMLQSINEQTYKNLELFIMDDSADLKEHEKIKTIIKASITNLEYTFQRNEQNLGSNKTFEKLTQLGAGDYFAYCDQDDMWEPEKIQLLVKKIEEENALICYSDLSIIDQHDKLIANSFKDISKRLEHVYGENKYSYFIRRNSITGCTMLIRSDVAKQSLPFPDYHAYVHDHWLTLFASCHGKIAYVAKPLVQYRIHGGNQIGAKVLDGISSRQDYIDVKLMSEKKKADYIILRGLSTIDKDIKNEVDQFNQYVETRLNLFNQLSFASLFSCLKYIIKDSQLIIFEILLAISPTSYSNRILNLAKK